MKACYDIAQSPIYSPFLPLFKTETKRKKKGMGRGNGDGDGDGDRELVFLGVGGGGVDKWSEDFFSELGFL